MAAVNNLLMSAAMAFLAKRKLNKINKTKRNCNTSEGLFGTVFKKLKEDANMFCLATRMSVRNFYILLALVKEDLKKSIAGKRISAEHMLALTLMFLAHGGSRHTYASQFKIPIVLVGKIINATCAVIWQVLSSIYMVTPTCDDWEHIAQQYEQKWKLPNCVGAIAGKHISIICPPAIKPFRNSKTKRNITLFGVCDAKFRFTLIEIAVYKKNFECEIFTDSLLCNSLKEEKLFIPEPKPLPTTTVPFPHYFVGGSDFPLLRNLMRPFNDALWPEEEVFNKKLSHARLTAENAFGVLLARWRILRKDVHGLQENAFYIIKACTILHNYLMAQNCTQYCPDNYIDNTDNANFVPGAWRTEINEPINRWQYDFEDALNIREKLSAYLNNNEDI